MSASGILQSLVFDSLKQRVVGRIKEAGRIEFGQITDEVAVQILVAAYLMHVLLVWRLALYIAGAFPEAVAAMRGIILALVFTAVFWIVFA